MYLKSPAMLEKGSISLKKSSKTIEIVIKAPHFLTEASISLEMSSKSLGIFIKSSYQFKRRLHFSVNVF
jgi:hypothetical protein